MISKGKLFLVTLFFIFPIFASAQNEFKEETNTKIQELADFHEIIYPIWHTAYPAKDYDALRSYVDEVNEKAEKIYNVKLPGILREKEEKWKKGVEELKYAVEKYNEAVSSGDDESLLNAAEELHSKYENLVRIIRPVIKELDEFHKILYVIYHKYYPDKKYEEIRKQCNALRETSSKLLSAKLPKRLESQKEKFDELTNNLIKSVDELCKAKDKDMDKAVEKMHSNYAAIQDLFE